MQQRKTTLCLLSLVSTLTALLTVGLLMGSHAPYSTVPAVSGLEERRTGSWHVVYILGSNCPCSKRVAQHLVNREKLAGIEERIVLVGEDKDTDRDLRGHGWSPDRWPAERARDVYGALNAPLMVFVDPGGSIRYSGGFARRSDSVDGFHEAEVWASLRAEKQVRVLPAYGCALQFGPAVGGLSQAAQQWRKL